MSTTTTTTVPAEVQLTPAQTKIQSLLRSTELRISLITTHLRALRLEKTLLLAVLPPLRKQSPADINRVNELGEKILAVERRMERDEEHKKWLEEAMRATVE
ncbi:hypothetical protein SLS59_004636 [Nothophoma quercina]|uniref:Uncharacterized protein n=1 Tax=Nothophoma quercina TaxID=749835 RepID=A0ABR3REV3_9PLEO